MLLLSSLDVTSWTGRTSSLVCSKMRRDFWVWIILPKFPGNTESLKRQRAYSETNLAPNHNDTLGSLFDLAYVLVEQNKFEGESLYRLQRVKNLLGKKHSVILPVIRRCSVATLKQDELEDVADRLLESQERLPSQGDRDITSMLYGLSVHDKQQKVHVTEGFHRRLLECHNTIHGSDKAFARVSSELSAMEMVEKTVRCCITKPTCLTVQHYSFTHDLILGQRVSGIYSHTIGSDAYENK